MNIPKLISILVVLVAVVALLFPTFDAAIPKNIEGNPFSFELDGGVGIQLNESTMMLELSMPTAKFGSQLPQDIKDVNVDVYVGTGNEKAKAGSYNFGTIPANGTVSREFVGENVSILYLLGYLPSLKTDGGIDLPVSIGIKFKYLEWNDSELIDMGVIVKAAGTETSGSITGPIVDGNSSSISVTANGPGLVQNVIDAIENEFGGEIEANFGYGSEASVSVVAMGDTVVVNVDGGSMSLYDFLKQMLEERGEIVFTYNGEMYTVQGDVANAALNALKSYYPEA